MPLRFDRMVDGETGLGTHDNIILDRIIPVGIMTI